MTARERLLAALSGDTVVPPPAAPIYLQLYLEPRRRRHLAQVYSEMAAGEIELRPTFEQEIEARLEALDRSLSVFRHPPAWLPIELGPGRAAVHGCRVRPGPHQCLWYPPGGGEPTDLLAPFDNRHGDLWECEGELPDPGLSLADLPPPSVAAIADSGALEYTTRAMSRFADRFLLYGSTGAPFWHCYSRLGFVGLMAGLRERPDLVDAWAQADLQRLLAGAAALRHAGVSCMFVEECLSGADLISVADYRRHAWPATRDLLAGLRDMGFRVVYYYCGSVEGRLEYLAHLPADALAFEESKKGFTIDLGRIREALGPDRLLFGNTDAVLLRDGSAAQIAAEVARQYAAAGPRFVVSQGSPATLDTPPEKLDVLGRGCESAGHESRVDGING